MRATLLTAQKMADSIVREAEAKRDTLMDQAEAQAQEKIAALRAEIAETEARLQAGRDELANFIAASREICAKELAFLDQLPEIPVSRAVPVEPVAAMEEQVQEIEEKVLAAFAEVEEVVEEEAEKEDSYPESDPFAKVEEEVSEPTRRINLDDLKFGRNYKGDE